MKKSVVSWSGGKDSCLATYRAMKQGFQPVQLFTVFSKENKISSAHRLPIEVVRAQGKALGIHHEVVESAFHDYEKCFVEYLKECKGKGINHGIFGDIDIEAHRQWEEKVCEQGNMEAVLPLWQENRQSIVKEFIELGFKAKIIVVNKTMLSTKFLGKDLTLDLLEDIAAEGADMCGENGEYHTVVYDGPIFEEPVRLKFGQEVIPVGDQWAQIKVMA